jgi:hypothetical protein
VDARAPAAKRQRMTVVLGEVLPDGPEPGGHRPQ